MSKVKIGTMEAIAIIVSIVVSHTISSLPSNVLSNTKSATIINLVFLSFVAILITYIIYRLLKNFGGLDIIDISELLGGKVFKNIIGSIFISYFIVNSAILLRNFCESLKLIYYPLTSVVFLVLLFVIAVGVANSFGFNSTIKTNLIILPLALVSIIFLFVANIKNFVPQRIFPIFGDGLYDTFVLGIGNLSAFAGIEFIYFLPPLLKDFGKFKKVCMGSIGILCVYLLLAISTILFMFSFFIDNNQILPLFVATRYIEFGNFFQRLESIFLLIWILVFSCYLSISCKFSINIFKKMTNIKDSKYLNYIFCLLIFAIAMLPRNYAVSQFFEKNIYPWLVIFIGMILGVAILAIANFKLKRR